MKAFRIFLSITFIITGFVSLLFDTITSFIFLGLAYIFYPKKSNKHLEKSSSEKISKAIKSHYSRNEFEKVIQYDSEDPYDLELIANAHSKLGNLDDCLTTYDKAIAMDISKFTQSKKILNKAIILHSLERYDDVIESMQSMDSECYNYFIKDKDYKPITCLGHSWYMKGDYPTALETFKQAPVNSKYIDDELKQIIFFLGNCYGRLGNRKMALKYLTKVKSIDRNYRDVEDLIDQYSVVD